jgi:hypothetical protein
MADLSVVAVSWLILTIVLHAGGVRSACVQDSSSDTVALQHNAEVTWMLKVKDSVLPPPEAPPCSAANGMRAVAHVGFGSPWTRLRARANKRCSAKGRMVMGATT